MQKILYINGKPVSAVDGRFRYNVQQRMPTGVEAAFPATSLPAPLCHKTKTAVSGASGSYGTCISGAEVALRQRAAALLVLAVIIIGSSSMCDVNFDRVRKSNGRPMGRRELYII